MKDLKSFGMKQPSNSDLTYDSYLKVDQIISSQKLQSDPPVHDEMLFIIIHQVYELWFKQILHELNAFEDSLRQSKLIFAIKVLKRILRIQDVLNQQINVLETMTPNDFNYFRSKLNPASGFQSYQFRLLEFRLGIRNKSYLGFYQNNSQACKDLEAVLTKETVYDTCLRYLKSLGLEINEKVFDRDLSLTRENDDAIAKEIAKLYQDSTKWQEGYEFVELLLDMDQKLEIWRFRHIQMVERIIGITMGTGGSQGVDYLRTTLKKRAFPEIWLARKYIVESLG